MKAINRFIVVPTLPAQIARLRELAINVLWCWEPDILALFRRLDPNLWELSGHNPVLMLGRLDQDQLETAAHDDGFLTHYANCCDKFDKYLNSKTTWYTQSLRDGYFFDNKKPLVAYFSAEFGLTECLSIFAGGLGILAGDYLKSTSDLGMPAVGIGLLYQEGYFRQYLSEAGRQMEASVSNDFHNLPILLERDTDGKPITVEIPFPGRTVTAQVWRVQVGRTPLFCLDTHVPENSPEDQAITNQLYGGDREMRIRQEMVLGIGGCKALGALSIDPAAYHMNEGHSAFLSLELVRKTMQDHGLTFAQAREAVSASLVFTTHTPEAAGHDYFAPDLVDRYLESMRKELGLNRSELLALGRTNPADEGQEFCMTTLALRLASYNNAVSELHGRVSRKMWQSAWPGVPEEDVPITAVTNGIHFRSWVSKDMQGFYDRYLGERWRQEPADETFWRKIERAPDQELWNIHERRRERLVTFTRERLAAQSEQRHLPASQVAAAAETLSPKALTIGFARRLVPYKRPLLIFRDLDRLARIIGNPDRPVQLIFAGKASPGDGFGQDVIRRIVDASRQERFCNQIAFIDNYDMAVARYLTQGCDVWLNNPRRPREACGTSGMKAAANGVLNASTLDGWWDEAWHGSEKTGRFIGWAIGRGEDFGSEDEQDQIESEALYDLLEHVIVPAFYERSGSGVPRKWAEYMKSSIGSLCHFFNTHRMAEEYARRFYLPGSERAKALSADHMARACALAAWKERVRNEWPHVRVEIDSASSGALSAVAAGATIPVQANVVLGHLTPEDVRVDLYLGEVSPDGEIRDADTIPMLPGSQVTPESFVYKTETQVPRGWSGLHGYTVKVTPAHPDVGPSPIPGFIAWASAGA